MLKRSIALLTCAILVFPSSGYSWGNKGHQTVGRIAQLFLQDDNAQTTLDKIRAILKPGESLASIAKWADTVKRVHFGPDAEAGFVPLTKRTMGTTRTYPFVAGQK